MYAGWSGSAGVDESADADAGGADPVMIRAPEAAGAACDVENRPFVREPLEGAAGATYAGRTGTGVDWIPNGVRSPRLSARSVAAA